MDTLASRIEREGGLQEVDAVGWAIRVARTIEGVHERGRVHGRLSAASVRIGSEQCTSEGHLLPFAELPENVAYHSPERERGEGGSQADDTWAVAVILYYALSGSLPFSGMTDDEVRRKIRTVPAPPLAVFDVGDDELQAIVDRALARDRDVRTGTVTKLRWELEAWHPDLQLDGLPPLLTDEELDEDVTIVHSGNNDEIRKMILAATAQRRAVAAQLSELVDETSVGDLDKSDLFAVPASRAAVRTLGANAPRIDAPPSSRAPMSSAPASSKPIPSAPAAPAPSSRTGLIVVCVLVALAAAGILAWSLLAPAGPPPADSAAPSGHADVPAPQMTQAPGASTGTTPLPSSAAASASAAGPSAPPAAAAQGDLTACMLPLFPADSFDPPTDFAFLCAETDATKAGAAVRTELVRAHRNMSEGMREWALLGWYELPAVSLLRSRCCPAARPIELPDTRGCTPMAEILGAMTTAAQATTDPADKTLQKAVEAYTSEIYCVVRSGIAHRFGRRSKPEGGEDTIFMRFLSRFVQAKR